MAHTVVELPDTFEKVGAMSFPHMVDTVTRLADPETIIQGVAGLQVNAFLAHAAVRMAKAISISPNGGFVKMELIELDRHVRNNVEIG